jgi:hypothetical protein
MSQLHMFVGKNNVHSSLSNSKNFGYILEETKLKSLKSNNSTHTNLKFSYRKKIRLFIFNFEDNSIYLIKEFPLVTTLRLSRCCLNNNANIFICSVADYSIKDCFNQHWSYVINLNEDIIENTVIINQLTSYCQTPFFHTDITTQKEYIVLDQYSRLSKNESNIVMSNCGKDRYIVRYLRVGNVVSNSEEDMIVKNNKSKENNPDKFVKECRYPLFFNFKYNKKIKNTYNIWTNYLDQVIKFEKNKIYINNQLKFNLNNSFPFIC